MIIRVNPFLSMWSDRITTRVAVDESMEMQFSRAILKQKYIFEYFYLFIVSVGDNNKFICLSFFFAFHYAIV